jgi:hypothetical protein
VSCVITVRPRRPFGRNESSDNRLNERGPDLDVPERGGREPPERHSVTRAAIAAPPPSIFSTVVAVVEKPSTA